MFLYLGGDISVRKSDIIGIFDIDNVNTQKTTKEFLRSAEKEGKLLLAGENLPKILPSYRRKEECACTKCKGTGDLVSAVGAKFVRTGFQRKYIRKRENIRSDMMKERREEYAGK